MINITRPSLPDFDEYCDEIRVLWDNRHLTNAGEKYRLLEERLKVFFDAAHVSLFANGHLALEAILTAMGLRGEVITTPFTFASTTHAIVRCGLTPVFCDIDPADYTIDISKIEGLITDNTCAILPVHVYGNFCDVDRIQQIADRYGLKVIYDAAHAFGASRNDVPSANFGDASMFSFHATKVFHTVEGGAVAFKDAALEKALDCYKNFGISGLDNVSAVGTNAKMNEFEAAMGLCNLRYIDEEIAKRKRLAERYRAHLSGISGIKLSRVQENTQSNYAYFPVVFDRYRADRDEIIARLAQNGIGARKYFYPLTNSFDCYSQTPGFDPAQTPVAQHIAQCVLTLPLYADLGIEDVDRICELIKGV